ncbi:MAG: L,D-transpeptidase family protein [Mycobacteriales bacterium]
MVARPASLAIYSAPGGSVARTLANPVESGAPLTFQLEHQEGEWLNVFLPVRPNGSTGWVRLDQVTVAGVPYRLDVLRSEHQLKLFNQDALTATYPIAIGTANTPTPGGTFYLKELIAPTNPAGDYGPYAYGLSGFSTTIETFNGGDAVIGLHGTNDPSSVGGDVSHGCIRLHNEDIVALAKLLPLGTPVRILS